MLFANFRERRACLFGVIHRLGCYVGRLPLPHSIKWRYSAHRYQPFGYTLPDRYPWLFAFARDHLPANARVMSFGCSVGEEVLSLRRYLPDAAIRGIDIDPGNISMARRRTAHLPNVELVWADAALQEADNSYDAVFCLAVLCNGRLTAGRRQRSDPLFRFGTFEAAVDDLCRCLKPGGLLFLLTTNFRFCDTGVSRNFDVVLSAPDDLLAPDLIYGRDNRLLEGVRYRDVVFRKRGLV